MKVLYIDSAELEFKFNIKKGLDDIETIHPFKSLEEVISYFNKKEKYELILYNPYIFMPLIIKEDYSFKKHLNSLSSRCIPHANAERLLQTSSLVEEKLTNLFPLEKNNPPNQIFDDSYDNKCVLVTGAGGSIGSELVLQLLKLGANTVVCLDLSEFSIFNLKSKISDNNKKKIKIYVGSYGDKNLLQNIFKKFQVDLIINAAAYKHVSIMELMPNAAFNNNVRNFVSMLKIAKENNVQDIIQVSTDKAADPSNIMGFSKFICEQLLINANKFLGASLNYSIVRFGNVIGSSGSVVPIFIENIKKDKKLKITHPDVNRFMMRLDEAVNLILYASRSRRNETYILDMGKAYKITDLAKMMLKHSLFLYQDNMIEYTGLEAGEKLSESLFTKAEKNLMTKYEKIFVLENTTNSVLKKSELESIYSDDLSNLEDIFLRLKS